VGGRWIRGAGWLSEAHPQRWRRGLEHPRRWGGDESRDDGSRCGVRDNGYRCKIRGWSRCRVRDGAEIGENCGQLVEGGDVAVGERGKRGARRRVIQGSGDVFEAG
jgi:hypothetical protein